LGGLETGAELDLPDEDRDAAVLLDGDPRVDERRVDQRRADRTRGPRDGACRRRPQRRDAEGDDQRAAALQEVAAGDLGLGERAHDASPAMARAPRATAFTIR